MTYMGSKRKYAKYIVPILNHYIKDNNITMFIDCFCGGANLVDKIECEQLVANDLSPTLIALHKQAQQDFSKIPIDGSREYWDKAYAEWKKIKKSMDKNIAFDLEMPLYEIGAIEWYASFSNGGFPRGYAKNSETRNYYQEGYRNHKMQAATENYKKIIFWQGDYRELTSKLFEKKDENIVLYCDSPYKGTKPYAIDNKFDFEIYYNWLRETSKKYPIFISEQSLPEDFTSIWEKDDAKRTCGKDNHFKAYERLYFIDNREENNGKKITI